jgi:hypothetical protein
MRRYLLCLGLIGTLGAQAPLHIVSVERRGPPPYEQVDRIYGLDGGQDRGLHVGDRLVVKRVGEAVALGHLRVTLVRGERSEGTFESSADSYPMKGDLAIREELKRIPVVPLDADPIPLVSTPRAATEAPPREGLLFFLPQRGELSPAGMKKVEGWVEAWGTGGRWTVLVPMAKALKPALQKQRAEALLHALRTLGIEQAAVESTPRTVEGKYDPAWIRHWD